MTLVLIAPSGKFNSSFKIKTKYHLHKMKCVIHPTKMINKPRKLYSKYKLPSAPHNTTQYLLSNYETDPKHFQNLYDEYNNGSMMGKFLKFLKFSKIFIFVIIGIVSPAKLRDDYGQSDVQRNKLDWIEEEMKIAKISNDKMTMNSIINKFGEVLKEQQIKISELEKQLQQNNQDKKNTIHMNVF